MPTIYCHNCQAQFSVPANTGECPSCGGGFVEEVPAAQAQPAGPAAGAAASGGGHSFTRTFTLPGGGRGTVYVSTGGLPGMGAGHPMGGVHDTGAGDPFVSQVLEAMLGGGFLHPGMGGMGAFGVPAGSGPFAGVGAGAGHPGEQEWLDRLMSQIMAEYQPASQAAAQRAVRSLPALAVRPKGARGEPGEGQAVARAGEPCSVCHDEFREGEEVLELPCSHNYHKDCLLPWLETHNTCPVCRYELPAEDPSVEARRRQRADAAAAAGSSTSSGSRQAQRRQQRGGPAAGPSGNRLADLLSNISASWDSLRGHDRSGSGDTAAAEAAHEPSSHPSSSQAAAGPSGSRDRSGAAAADQAAGYSTARPSAGPSPASGGSSGAAMLRQRREAAAQAAERRLRGESAPAAAMGPAAAATGWPGTSHAAPPAPPPSRVASAPHLPQHPAAEQQHRQQAEEEEEQGSSAAVAGAVAGGVLGALLGGALMLLGGRRRDRD
ncbi:hypothetical protein ABPG75_008335 [Micractinium tetrahymenae]